MPGDASGLRPAVVEMADLHLVLGGRTLIAGLDLRVGEAESVAIIGPSGSGKTSLLNCVLGSLLPRGSIRVEGTEVVGASRRELARVRSTLLGIVFQHGELLEELTPTQNVALAALVAGRARGWATARAAELLDALGVPQGDVTTGSLSGGERQRTALARALVNSPRLVLADEPTGSLDAETRDAVAEILFDAPRQWGCALLVVTHDPDVARRADRVLALRGGVLEPDEART